jgi:putative DNA primase/helicase
MTRPDDLADLRAALRARAAEVAECLLGRPTHRGRGELRWGRKGSLALAVAGPKAGLWHDHEAGAGGDMLDLIAGEKQCDFREALRWARDFLGEPEPLPGRDGRKPPPPPPPAAPSDAEREAAALRMWHAAREDIADTPAEAYLLSRGIRPERLPPHAGLPVMVWPPVLRWHAESGALLIGVNCGETGLIRAIQRILLNPDGTPKRRPDGSKLKLACGPIAGRAARFAWHPDPQGRWALAEGAETALAAAQLLGVPCWASLGASNMPRVAPPAWARSATVCADHDDAGLRSAQEAARRLRERGIEVRIITPFRERADAADMLREAA